MQSHEDDFVPYLIFPPGKARRIVMLLLFFGVLGLYWLMR